MHISAPPDAWIEALEAISLETPVDKLPDLDVPALVSELPDEKFLDVAWRLEQVSLLLRGAALTRSRRTDALAMTTAEKIASLIPIQCHRTATFSLLGIPVPDAALSCPGRRFCKDTCQQCAVGKKRTME